MNSIRYSGIILISLVVSLVVHTAFMIVWKSVTTTQKQINYNISSFEEALVDVIAAAKPSVVSIIISKDLVYYNTRYTQWQLRTQRTQIGGWSGIFVHKDGYILTNKHVLQDPDAEYNIVFADGTMMTGEAVRLDPVLDIAVIKVQNTISDETAVPARAISLEQEVKVGQFAVAIWNALAEYQNTVTLGIISGRNRSLGTQNENVYAWLYQTDTPINRGNSGWPLLDINGKVLGLNTAVSAEGSNIGFAIPLTQEFIDATIKSIQEYNMIARPFIGIQYLDLSIQEAERLKISQTKGVYITEVVEWTAAEAAGIQKWDILTAINGKYINEEYPFLYQLYSFVPGQEVSLTLVRDGMPRDLKVILGKNSK